MRERGYSPTKILTPPRRPCRPRHPYAVPRTSLQCVCTRRRNCIEQLSPSPEYAPGTAPFPARNSATIKLTHDPSGGSGVSLKNALERNRLVNRTRPCRVPAAGERRDRRRRRDRLQPATCTAPALATAARSSADSLSALAWPP